MINEFYNALVILLKKLADLFRSFIPPLFVMLINQERYMIMHIISIYNKNTKV